MDLRIEKTYRLLTDAFTSLLNEEPYEKISVSKLCDRAMIRRTTFYKHFADKDEFFVFYIQSVHDIFLARVTSDLETHDGSSQITDTADGTSGDGFLENSTSGTTRTVSQVPLEVGMLNEFTSFLDSHENLVNNVINSKSASLLLEALHETLALDFAHRIEMDNPGRREHDESLEMIASFCVGGVVRMLLQWWKNGRQPKERQIMIEILEKTHYALNEPSAER